MTIDAANAATDDNDPVQRCHFITADRTPRIPSYAGEDALAMPSLKMDGDWRLETACDRDDTAPAIRAVTRQHFPSTLFSTGLSEQGGGVDSPPIGRLLPKFPALQGIYRES